MGTWPAPVASMKKIFSIAEAERMLPLVGRIVEDLVRDHQRWTEKVAEFELATAGSTAGKPDAIAELLQGEAQRLAKDIESYIAELTELGVECKGMDTGLVDFPGQMDGRAVYYCWKLGEDGIQYWHDVNAGFAGRQRIKPLVLAE